MLERKTLLQHTTDNNDLTTRPAMMTTRTTKDSHCNELTETGERREERKYTRRRRFR